MKTETKQKWNGQALRLRYTDADDLTVLHHLPMSDGWYVMVVGNPSNGAYEWVISQGYEVRHSDCGYGDSDIALRDGLIEMYGLQNKSK